MESRDLAQLRTDIVGSLLRPTELRQAFVDYGAGKIGEEERRAMEDASIKEVVAKQERHGLPLVNDGEFRRIGYMTSFAEVAGLTDWSAGWSAMLQSLSEQSQQAESEGSGQGHDPARSVRQPATERLRLLYNKPLQEYRFTAALTDRPATVTVLGADRVLQGFDLEASKAVYDSPDGFADDVVGVHYEMVEGLASAGCRYVHIDEPGFTSYVDDLSLQAMHSRGEDPDANLERSIRANNALFDAFPDITFGVHVCRGNRQSMWHREGHYDALAERLFGELRCDRLLLEYDTERAGSFEPLRFVRPGTVAVLGLVSTKTPRLESVDELRRRIDEAARYLPLEQLALSTQCGFSSTIEGNLLSADDQWRKLDTVLEVADLTWG